MFGRAIAWCCVVVGTVACAGESTAPSGTAGIGGGGGSGASAGLLPVSAGASGSVTAPVAGSMAQPTEQRPSMDAGVPPAVAGSGSPQLSDAHVPIQDASQPVPNTGPVLPPITDPGATGPFTVRRIETIEGLATHGLIIPVELGRGGVKHPILVWINGASAGFSSYRTMLDNVAAQGFFIISDKQSGFDSATEVTAQRAAIDWAVSQAETAGSPYFGLIDRRASRSAATRSAPSPPSGT